MTVNIDLNNILNLIQTNDFVRILAVLLFIPIAICFIAFYFKFIRWTIAHIFGINMNAEKDEAQWQVEERREPVNIISLIITLLVSLLIIIKILQLLNLWH